MDHERGLAINDIARLVGEPKFGGIFIVCDHGGRAVPEGLDLGIEAADMNRHISHDIGVAAIAERMAGAAGTAALIAHYSRLVADLNRTADDPAAIPQESDGSAIPGNVGVDRAARLAAYHHPFHARLERELAATPPGLTLFLHSFTPRMATEDEARPWHCGVLYDADDRGAMIAKRLLEAEGLIVGDQEPYSGAVYNATIRRHAEEPGRPYLYLEVRQDMIADEEGQAAWTERLQMICNRTAMELM